MASASPPLRPLQFADFELDPRGPELRRDGRVVPLRPKSLALISHLAQKPGQLVRKQDLVDAVWGGTAVTDATLARTLFDAREARRRRRRRRQRRPQQYPQQRTQR